MRDIINKLNLTESTGITGRKPGDELISDAGSIYFKTVIPFPAEGGRLLPEELDQQIDAATEQYPSIIWVNPTFRNQAGGFVLALFDRDEAHTAGPGEEVFGRFFKEIHGYVRQNTWPNNSIPGYTLNTKQAKKMSSGLTPQDLLKQLDNLTPTSILKQVTESLGVDHPLLEPLSAVIAGGGGAISFAAPAAIPFAAFRDYFCEILQPIALLNHTVKDADEAIERFLGDEGVTGAVISFGKSKTDGLSDSVVTTPSGNALRISTKGGKKGASASVNNLLDAVDKIAINFTPKEAKAFLNKHKEAISIIRIIKSAGYRQAPIVLATRFGIITQDDAEIVEALYSLEKSGLVTYTTGLTGGRLSPRLKKLYAERVSRKPNEASAYAHLVTVLATKVAEHVNNRTDFSKSAAEILNHSALIQIYSDVTESQGVWTINGFTGRYPSVATTGVILDLKSYASTKLGGNFTFSILREDGTIEDVKPAEPVEDESHWPDDIDDVTDTARVPGEKTDLAAASATTAPVADTAALGRTRR